MQFHLAIAEATHNSMLVELFKQSGSGVLIIPCGFSSIFIYVIHSTVRNGWSITNRSLLL
ncbi:DNA-binding transcriptional repressor UxuR [Citrobacter werkmanii]|nr:DNA-binding transcriptional repressor UxuR [Citrobacter werkmanii]